MSKVVNRINDKSMGKTLIKVIANLVREGDVSKGKLTDTQVRNEAKKHSLTVTDSDGKMISANAISRARTTAINTLIRDVENGPGTTKDKQSTVDALEDLKDVRIVKEETRVDFGFDEGESIISFVKGLDL